MIKALFHAAGLLAAVAGLSMTAAAVADVPADSPIKDALERAERAAKAIATVAPADRTYENTVLAVDDLLTRLETDTNMLRFMQYVSTDAAEREKSVAAEEQAQNWLTEFGKRADVYAALRGFADSKPKLDALQQRLLERLLRDFKRTGMALPPEQREKLTEIEKEITRLGLDFEKGIRSDETRVPLTADELRGAPEDVLANVPKSGDVYLVGMDYPTYIPLMEQCSVEATREKLFLAYKRRGGRANVSILEKMLKLRAEQAALLGYACASDFENEVRMSKNAATVQKFYDDLRPIVRKKAQVDFDEYMAAKREETGNPNAKLQSWDQSYYEKYLLKKKYAVDSEEVKKYFPMQAAVDGLFAVTQSLYGLEYRDVTARAGSKDRPLWHPDVKLYEVWDKASNQLLGEFYLDMHPRENKYTHAACWGLVARKKYADGASQKPLAALVCNFPKPSADKPSLLPHDDVETFFHEFGHCLHNILTEVDIGMFAGANTARDFVEAPSQMFENWVWDPKVLNLFAKHYQTGQPLPKELLDGMIRARFMGKGLWAERQILYGSLDQAFHTQPDGVVNTIKTVDDLAANIELFPPVPQTYLHASFGHLVGYQAGYYGYMWSLVYASDMFQRFQELGMLNPEAGQYYRKKILARGDTLDAMDLVKDYLGRDPKPDAFRALLGLTSPN